VLHGGPIRSISFFTCLHQPFAGEAAKFCGFAGNIAVTASRTIGCRNNGHFTLWVWAFRTERAAAHSAIRLFCRGSWVHRERHGMVARRVEVNRSALDRIESFLGAVNTQEQPHRVSELLEVSNCQTEFLEKVVEALPMIQQRPASRFTIHQALYRGRRHAQ
jgi:hypothetical protein